MMIIVEVSEKKNYKNTLKEVPAARTEFCIIFVGIARRDLCEKGSLLDFSFNDVQKLN